LATSGHFPSFLPWDKLPTQTRSCFVGQKNVH
jgi:hypothetical protein